MGLLHLGLRNIRNLIDTEISPGSAINLVYGSNGSGKTSLLESIYVLGHAKSFRASRLRYVIRREENHFSVAGKAQQRSGDITPLRIDYQVGQVQIYANKQPLKRTSELAQRLPIILINTDSHRLLEDGPRLRRHFMDWGGFHVEQSYLPVWKRYYRALRQRNAALRHGGERMIDAAWNQELSQTAAEIHQQREYYIERLNPEFLDYVNELLDIETTAITYSPGWPTDQPLKDLLAEGATQDRQAGYTRFGPHRADFIVRVDGVPAEQSVSRGQQKLLICALHLAQARVLDQEGGVGCVVLVDDLAAELDPNHRNRLLRLLARINQQVFVTATEHDLFAVDQCPGIRMFHVEQGRISAVENLDS